MAVEDVSVPKIRTMDPKNVPEKNQDGVDYWEKKTKETRLKREYLEEKKMIDQTENPPPPPVDSPFRVSGEVKMGTIDLQQQQREAREEAARVQKEREDQLAAERARREAVEQRLHDVQIDTIRQAFETKLEQLRKDIQGNVSQKSFQEQYGEIKMLAQELGFSTKTSTGHDPIVELELAKWDYQKAKEEREFKLQMRNDDRKWQMEMQRLQDDRENKRQELEIKKKNQDMLLNTPRLLGEAAAKGMYGLMKQNGGNVEQKSAAGQHIEAAVGESGEADCPKCHSPMAIGSKASYAACPNCGLTVPIKRVGRQEQTKAQPSSLAEASSGPEEE